MNKKIVLSILTVVMLIAMSFTFVVGAQTDESTDKYESTPLYTKRAEDAVKDSSDSGDSGVVGSDINYVGANEESTILIPEILEQDGNAETNPLTYIVFTCTFRGVTFYCTMCPFVCTWFPTPFTCMAPDICHGGGDATATPTDAEMVYEMYGVQVFDELEETSILN